MIIHITGPPGAGKSTLVKAYKSKYKIYDLDRIHHHNNFRLKYYKEDFQNYINSVVSKNAQYVIIVGMHYPDPWIDDKKHVKPFKLTIKADKLICLNPGVETIAKQLIKRESIPDRDTKRIISDTKWWLNKFKKEGYTMMTPTELKSKLNSY